MQEVWMWVGFNALVLALLGVDLLVFHRDAHEDKVRAAAVRSFVWITLSLLFNLLIAQWQGTQAGLEFLTAYLIEKALSVDNLFVFLVIFTYFGVPSQYQHRVLFWGILGALIMRGAMIFAGA